MMQRGIQHWQLVPIWLGDVRIKVHAHEMKSHFTPRLLQVTVTAHEPTLWKWHITEADVEVAHGYAKTEKQLKSAEIAPYCDAFSGKSER